MNRIYILILFTSLLDAEISADIALTIGYNKFDDPELLRDSKRFYGFRAGAYQDGIYALQVGYEQANGVNCQGLNFKRTYINALIIIPQRHQFNSYGIATLGYEDSNIHRFKPSQLFVGAGLGIRKEFLQDFNAFFESKILKKLKNHDMDIVTTVGMGYYIK